MKWLLNWLINKNLVMKYFDGYKSQIAGIIIGIAFALDSVVGFGFLPPEVAAAVVAVSLALKQLAAVLGFVGGVGKLVKTGEKK